MTKRLPIHGRKTASCPVARRRTLIDSKSGKHRRTWPKRHTLSRLQLEGWIDRSRWSILSCEALRRSSDDGKFAPLLCTTRGPLRYHAYSIKSGPGTARVVPTRRPPFFVPRVRYVTEGLRGLVT